jgi:hypothetical protein
MIPILSNCSVWRDTYLDLAFEIKHHSLEQNNGKGIWNYYVVIPDTALSPEDFAKLWLDPEGSYTATYELTYYLTDKLPIAKCAWHGGITFYEKIIHPDTKFRAVKIGCDYNHLFDSEDGFPYNLEVVTSNVIRTIDQIASELRLKRRDPWSGVWDYPENMVDHAGYLYTKSGLVDMLSRTRMVTE